MQYNIQVITAPGTKFSNSYLISRLVDVWREDGHKVIIGPAGHLDADIGILHIDQTWIHDGLLPLNPHGCNVLNGKVVDISKRSFSDLIVKPGDGYDKSVIIKTNANCFGKRELKLHRWRRLLKLRRKLAKATNWRLVHELPGYYPIVENVKDVPGWVWARDDLVVERFMPERDGDFYVLRIWIFLGDHDYGVKIWSRDPVVKRSNTVRYEYIHDVPDNIRKWRKQLNFDFGKFDYVIVDGEAILLDVNKTPAIASNSGESSPNIINVAQGILSYL